MAQRFSILAGRPLQRTPAVREAAASPGTDERDLREALELVLASERSRRNDAEDKLLEMTAERDRLRIEVELALKDKAEAESQAAAAAITMAQASSTANDATRRANESAGSASARYEQRLREASEAKGTADEQLRTAAAEIQRITERLATETAARAAADARTERLAQQLVERPPVVLPAPQPAPSDGFEVTVVERDWNQDIKRLRITPKGE